MAKFANLACLLVGSAAASNTPTHFLPVNADPYDKSNNIASRVNSIHIDMAHYGAPENGYIYYPDHPGKYPWIDFFSGFFAAFPELIYDEMIGDIVKMGFVVSYTFPRHGMDGNDNVTIWLQQNDWYKTHIDTVVQNDSKDRRGHVVEVDVTVNGFASHSAGGELVNEVTIHDPRRVKAFWMLDPVMKQNPIDNTTSHGWIADEPKLLQDDQTVVVMGTSLCKQCCQHANNFDRRTYDSFQGMKIKTFQFLQDHGHCSCLNYVEANSCRLLGFCEMPGRFTRAELAQVHHCYAGHLVASMTDAFQPERTDTRKYYTDPAFMCPGQIYVADGTFECEGEWCPTV